MRAAWYERKGPAAEVLCLGEMPRPEPAPGEVLVRVLASALNPSDIKARSAWRGPAMPFPRVIPHQDGAGVIEAVGEGVDRARIGQRVWFYEAQWQRPYGSAAQWTAVPARHALPLPDGVTFAHGACLGVPALTAHRAVHMLGGVAGKRVLVQGGAGAVGFYAVQFAAAAGAAIVAASVRGEHGAGAARAAGAALVLDTSHDGVEDVLRRTPGAPAQFDRIVEVNLGANLGQDVRLLAPQGHLVAYSSDSDWTPALPMQAMMSAQVVLAPFLVYTMGREAKDAAVSAVDAMLRACALRHRIGRVLPLERIVQAHELQEQGKANGKIIIAPWTVQEAAGQALAGGRHHAATCASCATSAPWARKRAANASAASGREIR